MNLICFITEDGGAADNKILKYAKRAGKRTVDPAENQGGNDDQDKPGRTYGYCIPGLQHRWDKLQPGDFSSSTRW